MFKVKVMDLNGKQHEFLCNDKQTILDAACIQGNIIEYACKGGGCGLCKVRVKDGDFERGKSSKAVLPDSEREMDYTLACKTYAKSDIEVLI